MGHKGEKRNDSARAKTRRFKTNPRGNPSPIPLESCPWCGTRFQPDSFTLRPNDDHPKELRIVCANFECDFSGDRPLPILAVDEPIYRRLPAFLIATADKFASLPWVAETGKLLGGAQHFDGAGFHGLSERGGGQRLPAPLPPPDLVIQDELHLISGPLGTMVGLYEAAIEALCVREVDGRKVRPKIVASTATVRQAQNQIQALFARSMTQIFPPPGPDRRDSFFARTVPVEQTAGRLITEPRLTRKLGAMTGVPSPKLYAPPPEPSEPWAPARGIGAWRFPEWFVVQEAGGGDRPERSRRLVHRKGLDERGRFDRLPVVPTRFVRACPRGHVDDLDWAGFVHGPEDRCRRQLWLDEVGTTGDLADLLVRCECGRSRRLYEAAELDQNPLGTCRGARPWLGINTNEGCDHPSRLLIRTASNAYFPQIVSALSLPDRGTAAEGVVRDLWDDLQIVEDAADLAFMKKKPKVSEALAPFAVDEVLEAIGAIRHG